MDRKQRLICLFVLMTLTVSAAAAETITLEIYMEGYDGTELTKQVQQELASVVDCVEFLTEPVPIQPEPQGARVVSIHGVEFCESMGSSWRKLTEI